MTVRCAVLQTAPRFGDVEGNLAAIEDTVAGLDGVDLVVAPELATTGYDIDGLAERGHELAEPLDGDSVDRMRRLAVRHGLTLVVGVLEHDDVGSLFDTVVTCTPDGGMVPYRKTHVYPAEEGLFTAGDELLTVPTPVGDVGPMICFDHAFPEVATTLALAGAQVIANPAAVPNGYEHLLELRSRARAQDNQVFVVAANLAGDQFCGRSVVADPRGQVLASAGPEPTRLVVELDLDQITSERRAEPALRLRRADLYS